MTEAQEQPKVEAPQEGTTEAVAQEQEAQAVDTQPTADAPNPVESVEIPEKFRKADGSVDTERLIKSYGEMEKKLHSPEEAAKRKSVGDILPQLSQPMLPETPAGSDFYSDPMGVVQAEIKRAVAPYEAKLKYNEMAQALEKTKATFPKFAEWETEISDEITGTRALLALAQYGEPSVFELAYSRVLSKKQAELEKAAYERGKTERQVVSASKPRVEGSSASAPAPIAVSAGEAFRSAIESGKTVEQAIVDDAVLTPSEKKWIEKNLKRGN